MAEEQPTLTSIAAQISSLSSTLSTYLKDNNIPAPTFAANSPTSYSNLSPDIFLVRQALLDQLNDLWYLTQGPSESIFNYVHCALPDAACLNVLNHFDFWSAVPLTGSASYASIAAHVSLPVDVVTRVIQHGATLRIFALTPSGDVAHTSRSAALAQSAGLRALTSTILDDAGAPMMVLNEALARYSRGKEELTPKMDETSFALFQRGRGGHGNSWELLERDGEGEKEGWRARNFVEFMRYVKEIFGLEGVVLGAFEWGSVGAARVVDVGGSAGHDAVVLAKAFPELRVTVQDLPKVRSEFEASVPAELRDRVDFVEHDFFNPQPVQGADVYVFKMILHDWPDLEAAKILRALVPALKLGARVLLFEYIGSHDAGESGAPPLPRSIQQMGTATDLRLMALFNAKERPVEAWKEIFKLADERFEVADVKANPQQNFFATIEAVWRG